MHTFGGIRQTQGDFAESGFGHVTSICRLADDSLDFLESKGCFPGCIVKGTGMQIQPKFESAGRVRLELTGRMNANALGELRRAIERVQRRRGRVTIDLSEITLVDRPSLEFL